MVPSPAILALVVGLGYQDPNHNTDAPVTPPVSRVLHDGGAAACHALCPRLCSAVPRPPFQAPGIAKPRLAALCRPGSALKYLPFPLELLFVSLILVCALFLSYKEEFK